MGANGRDKSRPYHCSSVIKVSLGILYNRKGDLGVLFAHTPDIHVISMAEYSLAATISTLQNREDAQDVEEQVQHGDKE